MSLQRVIARGPRQRSRSSARRSHRDPPRRPPPARPPGCTAPPAPRRSRCSRAPQSASSSTSGGRPARTAGELPLPRARQTGLVRSLGSARAPRARTATAPWPPPWSHTHAATIPPVARDPRHLREPRHRIAHEVHDQLRERDVEPGVLAKGQVLGRGQCAPPRPGWRRRAASTNGSDGSDRGHASGTEPATSSRGQRSGAAAHVERACPACTLARSASWARAVASTPHEPPVRLGGDLEGHGGPLSAVTPTGRGGGSRGGKSAGSRAASTLNSSTSSGRPQK